MTASRPGGRAPVRSARPEGRAAVQQPEEEAERRSRPAETGEGQGFEGPADRARAGGAGRAAAGSMRLPGPSRSSTRTS